MERNDISPWKQHDLELVATFSANLIPFRPPVVLRWIQVFWQEPMDRVNIFVLGDVMDHARVKRASLFFVKNTLS